MSTGVDTSSPTNLTDLEFSEETVLTQIINFSIQDGEPGPIFALDRPATAFVDLTGDNFKNFVLRFRVVNHPGLPPENSIFERTFASPGQYLISGAFTLDGVAIGGTANGTVTVRY